MICPLKLGRIIAECDEELCAWYDNEKEQCCIKTISQLKVSGKVNTHTI